MATQKIRYDIEAAVSGGSEVNALASSLEGLAGTLEGELKVQALASAAALRQLGEKQGAIDTFRRLKGEVEGAAGSLREAQTAAQQLGQKIAASEAPTRAQAGQLQKLRDSVRAAKTELQQKTVALDQSRGALRTYGVGTDNLAQSERNVRVAIAASKAEVRQLVPAYQQAGQAAATSGRQQAQASTEARAGLNGLADQLRTVQNIAVAALGGSFVGGLVKDVARTADEYNNLAARIKLATGEGEAFERAMQAVTDISLRTNSSLESTGTLFARLTDAGKNAGLGAAAAQSQALQLTETINQAVQVSGASAQSSNAALIQLIQGLQSGVLRGEEFNSVMEQSPRLARALADGLGVTTGELRKMANQGALTTEVVIGALKSQADTLKTEYATLPPTIGRAIQNLSTSWTVYVGEADKATGASRTAATAINALAQNLDTIAGLLLDVGQAAGAFAALRLAQTFLGIGAAATASATAIAANSTAMGAAGAAATGAAAGVGRLAALFSTLRTFSLIGIVTNFQDIGTWIGEGIAKLQGYKDATVQLEQAERSRQVVAEEQRRLTDAQAAANRAALEAQFELSNAARASLGAFDELTQKGKTAAEAVREIGKDFDLNSAPGIVNAAAVLDKLVADGRISAEQFRQAWADALKGEDLAVFEVRARAALSGSAREAERLSGILDASLREAIRRSGADFAVLAGGMGAASRSAINDTQLIIDNLQRLEAQGVNTGAALQASISQGIKTADGQAAIESLRGQIEGLRDQLGEPVVGGLLEQLGQRAREVTGAVGDLAAALKKLGISSDADLSAAAAASRRLFEQVRATGGSAREQALAFKKLAEDAIASGDQTAIAFARSQAAAQGMEVTTDSAGRTIVSAMTDAAAAVTGLGRATDGATTAQRGLAVAAGETNRVLSEQLGYADRLAKRNASVKSSSNTDSDGFSADAKGNRIAAGSDLGTLTGIKNFLTQAGLNDAQAKQLALEFSDGKGEIPYFSNPGQIKYGGRNGTLSDALLKAAERTTFAPTQSAPGQPGAGAAAPGGERTVNVRLIDTRGNTRTVQTNDAGADALIETLRSASLTAQG